MHFCVSREMYNIEDRHFGLNRALLLAVGLWPYHRSKLVKIQTICFFTILISSIIFQLTTFITSKCSANLVIRVLTFTFAFVALAIKYNSFCVNRGTVKLIMEQLQYMCDNLKDNNERAIIERYGKKAKRHTTAMTMSYVLCLLLITIAQLWPEIVNVVLSVPRPRRLLIITEYFVDQEKYFYLPLMHIGIAGGVGIIALVATGSTLIAYFQHVCGMFKIASYRIEQWINIHMLNCTSLLNGKLDNEDLICAVDIHCQAMMFSKYLTSKFEISFMFLIMCGVLILSLNIFRIFQVVSSDYRTDEFLLHLGSISICIIYMFIFNFIGQEITDHNNDIYATAYKVKWYKTPLYVQKLTLFLLQRGNKSFGIHIGQLLIASLQCFATMANASISYFTVMYSAR